MMLARNCFSTDSVFTPSIFLHSSALTSKFKMRLYFIECHLRPHNPLRSLLIISMRETLVFNNDIWINSSSLGSSERSNVLQDDLIFFNWHKVCSSCCQKFIKTFIRSFSYSFPTWLVYCCQKQNQSIKVSHFIEQQAAAALYNTTSHRSNINCQICGLSISG